MKNLGIFINESFFLSLAFLREVKQSINCNISLSLVIFNLKMVLKELLGLAGLTKIQVLHSHESTEIIIVSKDKDLIFTVF